MSTKMNPIKNERRDLIGTIVACSVIALLIALNLFNPLLDGHFNTALSAALPQGLRTDELSGGAYWTLLIAVIAQNLALIGLVFTIGFSAIIMLRGEMFSKRNARLTSAASWMVLAWGIFHFPIEGLGNNLAAHQLGLDYWYDLPSGGNSAVSFWILTMVLIGSYAVTINRGMKLEEDVDGLV